MAVDPCADSCLIQLDQTQMAEIYEFFNRKIRLDLQADYDCKKINGATFADTWAKMMAPTISAIMSSMVSIATKETAADRAIKNAQAEEIPIKSAREDTLALATNNLKTQQGLLYARQAKGFDDNAYQKLFDSQLNAWSMVFADTDLTEVTSPIQDAHICDSFQRIKVGMGELAGDCAPIP